MRNIPFARPFIGDEEKNAAAEVLNGTSYQALRLHYAEDFSIREIGKIMGKTETGIKVTLFRARQKLQKKAITRGISL